MKDESVYFINVFSTLSAICPIAFGFLFLKNATKLMRIFLAFLVIGFIVDLMGWYNYHYPIEKIYLPIRELYWLIDFSFYAGFLYHISQKQTVKVIARLIWVVLFVGWLARYFDSSLLDLFKLTVGVAFSFLSGFILLELVENKKVKSLSLEFWIALGIFFYHFCTFFIMGMISTTTGNKIWWLHNAINIITNLIFALGFLIGRK